MLDLSIIHIQQQEGTDSSASATGKQEGDTSNSQMSMVQKDIGDMDPSIPQNIGQNDMSMIMHDLS